jgi:toxin ParE1/3/4
MVVIVTGPAEADLEHIADYIATGNPVRALIFVRELRDKCEVLADAPRAYPLVPRYEHFGIRRRPYGYYLIFLPHWRRHHRHRAHSPRRPEL